jgi:hypothetical protein
LNRFNRNKYENIIRLIVISIFCFIQMSLHTFKSFIGDYRRKSETLTKICKYQLHFSEETVSFCVSVLFIVILIVIQKPKRFSEYIIQTYGPFMKKKFYLEKINTLQNENMSQQEGCCPSFTHFCCFGKNNLFLKFLSKILLPISPFCSKYLLETIAIYVIYTYDILNIFTYVYSSFLVLPIFQMLRNKGGILVDFIFQIVHVFFIGLKFYPLLVIRDIDETCFTNLISFIYTFILLILKMINKALCSRTEVFIQIVLNDIYQIDNSSRKHLDNFNLTNLLPAKIDKDELVYEDLMQVKIPKLFDDTFKDEEINLYQKWISSSATKSNNLMTILSQNFFNASKPVGYRKISSSFGKQNILKFSDDIYKNENTDLANLLRGLLENLPLYISISYLLASYSVSFFRIIMSNYKKKNKTDLTSREVLLMELETYKSDYMKDPREKFQCDLCVKNFYRSKYKFENQNYNYVMKSIIIEEKETKEQDKNESKSNILHLNDNKEKQSKEPLLKPVSAEKKTKSLKEKNLIKDFEFQYSKQFVYTYTVAFMIVYFFSIFLFRVSNLYGGLTEKFVEFIIRIIFKNDIDISHLKEFFILTEFRIAYSITSAISFLQLIKSISAFNERIRDLSENNNKDKEKSFFLLNNSERARVVRKSLHFSGFLVAHLVYGYIILLFFILLIILILRIFIQIPSIFFDLIQFILPIFLMIMLKSTFIRSIILGFFKCHYCKMRQSLNTHATLSYFNFFFDCFLGFLT